MFHLSRQERRNRRKKFMVLGTESSSHPSVVRYPLLCASHVLSRYSTVSYLHTCSLVLYTVSIDRYRYRCTLLPCRGHIPNETVDQKRLKTTIRTPRHATHARQDKTAATDKYDYECSNGEGWVKDIQTPLWNPDNTDEACWSNDACNSGVCVVTNETDISLGTKVRGDKRCSIMSRHFFIQIVLQNDRQSSTSDRCRSRGVPRGWTDCCRHTNPPSPPQTTAVQNPQGVFLFVGLF